MRHPRSPHWYGKDYQRHLDIPEKVTSWLMDVDSLTARLICACDGEFSVRLLRQYRTRPDPSESRALGLRLGEGVLAREVQLLCNNKPWVFARSVIPNKTLSGRHRRLKHLGESPLGAYLFKDKSMKRDAVELACITPAHQLFAIATEKNTSKNVAAIWGRRSLFRLSGKPILVSEFFLPDIAVYPR